MKIFRWLILGAMIFLSVSCKPKPHVKWTAYTPEVMKTALQSGKPVVAEFYAAWCGPCMEMKEETFTDPRVIAALEPFIRIKADMSFTGSDKVQKIADEFHISGLPAMIFFDPSGKVHNRLQGFVGPEELLEVIQKYQSKFPLPAVSSVQQESKKV